MNDRQKQEQPAKSKSIWELIKVNLELGTSKALLVLPTQWLQVTMRRQQTALVSKDNPRILSARGAFNEIAPDAKKVFKHPLQMLQNMHLAGEQAAKIAAKYPTVSYLNAALKSNPLYGINKGLLPSAGKEGLKNGLYKGAVIMKAPDFSAQLLEYTPLSKTTSPVYHHLVQAMLAGGMSATTDVVVGGALDSWATQAATSHGKDANANYLKEVQAEKTLAGKVQRAYRGFGPAIGKSWISFTTMYATAEPIKIGVKQLYGLQGNEKPWYAALTSAVFSGVSVALTSSVPDLFKTWKQMPNPTQASLLEAMANNYKRYGFSGMIVGVPLKSVLVIAGWGLTFAVTQDRGHAPVPKQKKLSAPGAHGFHHVKKPEVVETTPQLTSLPRNGRS
jgi:hypothetical protein